MRPDSRYPTNWMVVNEDFDRVAVKAFFCIFFIWCYVPRMNTRIAIMNRAEYAARKRGHNGFSFDHIANDVGIQKASMYHHFSNKSELLMAIFERFANRIYDWFGEQQNSDKNAGGRLLDYLEETRLVLDDGSSICMSIAFSIDHESLKPELAEGLRLFQRANINWLKETFELGRQDKSISNIGDIEEEAMAALTMVDGALVMARLHNDPALFDKATRLLQSRVS